MPSFTKTVVLVKAALSGQYDKRGVSKFEHCIRVAKNMDTLIKKYKITDKNYLLSALLHDIIEDSDITEEDLYSFGFNKEVVDSVVMVSHDEENSYSDYIDKLCREGSLMAVLTKLADNLDNTDINRYDGLDQNFCDYLNKRYSGVQEKLIATINSRTGETL